MANGVAEGSTGAMDRRRVVRTLLARRGSALVVAGLGSSCYDVGTRDHPGNFYLWGAMGGAAMIGLGLALAQPRRRVLVVTGDGELLMGLGSLATIGARRPKNLAIVVLDNEHYAETGMQPTHTRAGVSLAGVAKACGFAVAETIRTPAEVRSAPGALYRAPGPVLFDVKVSTKRYPMSIRLRDGAQIKNRFRAHLLGAKGVE
jgi:thiamine pyrophosphate-dependent acetolactate synthase large subunit-like protein